MSVRTPIVRPTSGARHGHPLLVDRSLFAELRVLTGEIEIDAGTMKMLAVISILALLTISGAAYTDQLLTSGHQTTQRVN